MGLRTARPEHGGLVSGQGSGSKEVRCRSSTLGWDTGQGDCGGLETRQGTCAEARGWGVGSPAEGFLYQVFVQTQFGGRGCCQN